MTLPATAAARATAPARAPAPTRRPARPVQSPRRPAPAPQRPRHLDVVRGRAVPGRRPPSLIVVLLVALMGAALLALVTVNVLLGQTGIMRAELQQRVDDIRTVAEQSGLEVLQMSAPSRIEKRAKKLGLVPAAGAIVLGPETVRGPSPERGRP